MSDQKGEYPPPMPPRPVENQQQQQGYYAPTPSGPDHTQAPPEQQWQQQPPPYQGSQGAQNYYPPPPQAPTQPGGNTGPVNASNKPTWGERLYQWSTKAGVPINKVTNKLGSEAFWPSALDLECDKAARILKSFTKDGFYANDASASTTTAAAAAAAGKASPAPSGKPGKSLVKIPQQAIQTAAGLAIFTTFRTGFHISGAGGSGVVVSRLPDGSWSPPSGFLVHTLGAGFLIGLDIYDCVCVLRTPEAVRAFTHPRLSLGGEVGLVAGPVGGGASLEAAMSRANTKPVWSYMKSRGLYAGVQADGTVIVARPDANAAFYGEKGISVDKILRGEVPRTGGLWPQGARHLIEVLKAAEGKSVDEGVMREVSSGPTPGDLGVADNEKEVELADEKKHYA